MEKFPQFFRLFGKCFHWVNAFFLFNYPEVLFYHGKGVFSTLAGEMRGILFSVRGDFQRGEAVFFRNGTQHTAGISGSQHTAGNVVSYHTACPDDAASTNSDTAANSSVGTNPYIIFQCDGGRSADAFPSLSSIHGMSSTGKADAGADESVGTEMHRRSIQNDAVVIDEGQPVGVDMEAIITMKRWLDKCQGMASAEKLLQDFSPLFRFCRSGLVVFPAKGFAFVCKWLGMSVWRVQ